MKDNDEPWLEGGKASHMIFMLLNEPAVCLSEQHADVFLHFVCDHTLSQVFKDPENKGRRINLKCYIVVPTQRKESYENVKVTVF